MNYPSSTREDPKATCYVCGEVKAKHHMVNIGWDKENTGYYIYRCEGCSAGSPKWIKYQMHKSTIRKYYESTVAEVMATAEKRKERGKELAATNRERRREKLPKKSRVATPAKMARREGRDTVSEERKEQSWRNVVIRRSRRAKV